MVVMSCQFARPPKNSVAYQSPTLTVTQVSPHVYQHTSFLESSSFGRVPCNGIVVVSEGEAVVFDTPATDSSSRELIAFTETKLKAKIKAVVPTHFHSDCLGGLTMFHSKNIASYAHNPTIRLAAASNAVVPQQGFDEQLIMSVGSKKVVARFMGEGHTKDNIVAYFPEERVLFGGCLIKEKGAGKGNLADANVAAWPQTVTKLKLTYPQTRVLIPGHGQAGGLELCDYTIQLFK